MKRAFIASLGLVGLLALTEAIAAPPRGPDVAQSQKDGKKGGSSKGTTRKPAAPPAQPPSKPAPDRDIGVPQPQNPSWSPPAQPKPAAPAQPRAVQQPESRPVQPGAAPSQPESRPVQPGAAPGQPEQPRSDKPSEPAAGGSPAPAPPARGSGAELTAPAPRGDVSARPDAGPAGAGPETVQVTERNPVPPKANVPSSVDLSRRVAGDNADLRTMHGAPPAGGARPYAGPPAQHVRPAHSADHRYARPNPHHVRPHPHAPHGPPPYWYYRPYYTHWYVHPYYRHVHASWVVVHFDFVPTPWVVVWAPPPRAGWVWMPGYWSAVGVWVPGYWTPTAPAPVYRGSSYVYVPGWWQGDIYVEGYWRVESRSGWAWTDGYYLPDGTFVRGHWEPSGAGPEGYTWEAGFFDGDQWIEGFWRPEFRTGYRWVDAWFDSDGAYHAGFWEPTDERPGFVWVPGWFDGASWVEGYWVTDAEYKAADPANYKPEKGWDEGWDEPDAANPAEGDEAPLAIPIAAE